MKKMKIKKNKKNKENNETKIDLDLDRFMQIRFVPEEYHAWHETSNRLSHPGIVYKHVHKDCNYYPFLSGSSIEKTNAFKVDIEDCINLLVGGYFNLKSTVPRNIFIMHELKEDFSKQQKYLDRLEAFLKTN